MKVRKEWHSEESGRVVLLADSQAPATVNLFSVLIIGFIPDKEWKFIFRKIVPCSWLLMETRFAVMCQRMLRSVVTDRWISIVILTVR